MAPERINERWVKPAPKHARVRDPRYPNLFFPAEGVAVSSLDFQIERMIQEGDLVECAPPAPAAVPAAAPEAAPEPDAEAPAPVEPAPEPAAAAEPADPSDAAPPPASESAQ